MTLGLVKASLDMIRKPKVTYTKNSKWNLLEIKNFCALKDTVKKMNSNNKQPQNGRKFSQIVDLIGDLYLEYIKDSYNSIIKRRRTQILKKWAKDSYRHFPQQRYANGPLAHQKMFNILTTSDLKVKPQ